MAARPQISGWQWTFSFAFFTPLRCAAVADEIYFLIYYLQPKDRKKQDNEKLEEKEESTSLGLVQRIDPTARHLLAGSSVT